MGKSVYGGMRMSSCGCRKTLFVLVLSCDSVGVRMCGACELSAVAI